MLTYDAVWRAVRAMRDWEWSGEVVAELSDTRARELVARIAAAIATPAAPTAETVPTVRVRVAVAVTAYGEWSAWGDDDADEPTAAREGKP